MLDKMNPTKGLKFEHSSNVDPLRRKCSIATIQSDPDGHFATIIENIKEAGNYQNILLEVSRYLLLKYGIKGVVH